MNFEGSVTINASRDKVWQFLTNPEGVSQCVPGLESVEVIAPNEKFLAIASLGLGTVRVKFKIEVEWVELDAPNRASLKAKGTAPGNSMEATSQMELSNGTNGETVLQWAADVKIMGNLASMASRLMGGLTKKLTAAFFECVQKKIET